MTEDKKKSKKKKGPHNFMIKLPKNWHEKMIELQHKKQFSSVQRMYQTAVEEILRSNKMI